VVERRPGDGEVQYRLTADLRALTEVWRGDRSWAEALRSGRVRVHGPETVRRALPGWFTLSLFASVPRPDGQPSAIKR